MQKLQKLGFRLSRVADFGGEYEPLRKKTERVPEGHVPVYVGEEMERFVVRAELLGKPAFMELLRRSAAEYGYEQSGGLQIPCSVPLFRRVLRSLVAGGVGEAEEEIARELRGGED